MDPAYDADMEPRVACGAFIFEETWRSWDSVQLMEACETLAACGVNRFMTETWNLNQGLIDAVHQSGLDFWTSVSCYSHHGGSVPEMRPEVAPITSTGDERPQMEWYLGLIPTDPAYNLALAERCGLIAANYDIDGFCLDFMRWPLHWEVELREGEVPMESSFDPLTLNAYRSVNPTLPSDAEGDAAAAWIAKHDQAGWIDFKCSIITENSTRCVEAIRSSRPDLPTSLFVVPGDDATRRRWVGQDVRVLAGVFDELLPMTYHRIVQRGLSWVAETVREMRSCAPGATVIPVVQVASDQQFSGDSDWGAPMAEGEQKTALHTAWTASDCSGVVVFPGEAVLMGPSKLEIRAAIAACARPRTEPLEKGAYGTHCTRGPHEGIPERFFEPSTISPLTSKMGSSWWWSAHRAVASPRLCVWLLGSNQSPAARYCSVTTM